MTARRARAKGRWSRPERFSQGITKRPDLAIRPFHFVLRACQRQHLIPESGPAAAPVARRHSVLLPEGPAEMREIVEAPGERDFADMPVGVGRRREGAMALRQPLAEQIALKRGLLVRQQVVHVARRDTQRRGCVGQRQAGIRQVRPDIGFQAVQQRGAMGRRQVRADGQPLAHRQREQIERLIGQPVPGDIVDLIDQA